MQQLNNTSAAQGQQQHKRLPSRLFVALFFLLPLVGWGQHPFTLTTPDDVTNHNETLYWMESIGANGFYAIPHTDNSSVSTTNMPNLKALWYFMDAGIESNTQYYYIVNHNTGNYLKLSGSLGSNGSITIASFGSGGDAFKFFIGGSEGQWIFYPKSGNGNYWVNKQSGNVPYDKYFKSSNYGGSPDANSKWNFVAKNSVTWAHPFINSTNSEKHYYYIHNATPNGSAYYISTDDDSDPYATVSNVDDDKRIWYFMEAASDNNIPNFKYYYIVNAITGKYLKFTGTANGNVQANSLRLYEHNGTETGETENRFQFMVLNAKGDTYSAYAIMPKLEINYYYNKNASLSPESSYNNSLSNNKKISIYNDRGQNNNYAHWYIEETVFPTSCATPTITYSSETGKITITTTTPDAVIHYTTDGVTVPSSTVGTLYEGPFDVSAPVTIKAIATKTGYDPSGVETVSFDQVATPGFELTDDAKVRLTCATSGASIYYAMGTTQPTSVTIDPSNLYSGPIENAAGKYIAAVAVKDGLWINSTLLQTGQITFPCAKPVIRKTSATTFTITCSYPTSGVTIRYNIGANHGVPDDPTPTSGTVYNGAVTFNQSELPFTVKAIAYATNYANSAVATQELTVDLIPDDDGYYIIANHDDFVTFVSMVNGNATNAGANYKITADINASGTGVIDQYPFTGELKSVTKADGTFPVVSGLSHAIFNTVDGGRVHDIMLKSVNISGNDNIGAICNEATGAARIYNCGILPTSITYNTNGIITGTGSTVSSSDGYCGSLVGQIDGNARVINSFSYAFITGGTTVGGIVGYNATDSITQVNVETVGMVVNCMFYGDITGGTNKYPVYGGSMIRNEREDVDGENIIYGVNPYDYFRKTATFDDSYGNIDAYNRSWPAEEKNLVRFEYYRSVLNSNRRLCTWWVNGTNGVAPTDDDVADVGIAKWVLDKTIAPYPILKKWGKYPSIINIDTVNVYNSRTNTIVARTAAKEWEGKRMGKLKVNIYPGTGNSSASSVTKNLVVTDMDTLNYDFCTYKVQLPYYNEIFGNPEGATHAEKYGNNYTDKVVTGWMVTAVDHEGTNHFVANWESGYNFADRKCTDKDLYTTSGRVFAQGGYYYVPEGVTEISITAKWGNAVYLSNRGHSIDRVKVAFGHQNHFKDDKPFAPAGTIATTFQNQTVYNDLQLAIKALSTNSTCPTVYDQAIVLIGNHQVKNGSTAVGKSLDSDWHPFTIMSADFDFDNEPDYCLELQFRKEVDRPSIQPIRFDFLPVVELGLAVRPNNLAYAIGIMVPQGHFEVTETSFMRTTQFEYDGAHSRMETKSPVIINGGEYELFNIRKFNTTPVNRTSYFILGGHAWVHRFAPGPHPNNGNQDLTTLPEVCLCAVNVLGGEYPEFYLSGINRPDKTFPANHHQGDPHCYTNGGKFEMMAGAGYEEVKGDITFRINRSLIKEFYGGGINGSKPVLGSIDVVIDSSRVTKYCGGPRVGSMANNKTISTSGIGTVFTQFFGGGNGGNSYYREMQDDGDWASTGSEGISNWSHRKYHWNTFNPLGTHDDGTDNKGYHAEYEMEVFNQSNGVADEVTKRGYFKWIQFGTTLTGSVTNTLTGCTVEENFYGGGNMGNVTGTVTSTLTDCTLLGDVFGAGFSADTATFYVEDKAATEANGFPSIDFAGTITPAKVFYIMDGTEPRSYKWTNQILEGHDEAWMKQHPTFQINGQGQWYCYTWNSLANLGAVTGNVTLTLNGKTTVGYQEGSVLHGGNVFGGGYASAVIGNTSVILKDKTHVYGNVYGGGNEGEVSGASSVSIEN